MEWEVCLWADSSLPAATLISTCCLCCCWWLPTWCCPSISWENFSARLRRERVVIVNCCCDPPRPGSDLGCALPTNALYFGMSHVHRFRELSDSCSPFSKTVRYFECRQEGQDAAAATGVKWYLLFGCTTIRLSLFASLSHQSTFIYFAVNSYRWPAQTAAGQGSYRVVLSHCYVGNTAAWF